MTRRQKLAALRAAISSNVVQHRDIVTINGQLFRDISPLICDDPTIPQPPHAGETE